MRYTIKSVKDKSEVTDYTLYGNVNDLTQAVKELEEKGEVVVTTSVTLVTMGGRPYPGTNLKRK